LLTPPDRKATLVRVTTAFNRVLGLEGTSVCSVDFTDDGIVVGVRRRARVHRCSCGRRVHGRYDTSRRRWRHIDMGTSKVWLEAEIARIDCPGCGRVRTEEVPWARPGARHTCDFEDVVAWLAQRMDKTALAQLMRCAWETVAAIVTRVVAEQLDDSRLDDLYRIGVDEISYKRGHRYLTVVNNHDTGDVVWVGTGRSVATMQAFYDELGEDRCAHLEAVTMDGGKAYIGATQTNAPEATICFDAFHVIKWTNEAVDAVFRASAIPSLKQQMRATRSNAPWRKARYVLRAGRQKLKKEHQQILAMIRAERVEVHKAYLLKEELRDLFQIIEPDDAAAYLTDWIKRAGMSRIGPMVSLARKIQGHFDGIVAAVQLGLSNSRSEGINTKIRVIQRRGYGHPHADSLTAMIYLCCSGMNLSLPTQT
jgi:transposase